MVGKMTFLATQRRDRLAASAIDISSSIGVSYVVQTDELSSDTFVQIHHEPMSDHDLVELDLCHEAIECRRFELNGASSGTMHCLPLLGFPTGHGICACADGAPCSRVAPPSAGTHGSVDKTLD
jgi:hypothetical protein